MKYLLTYLLLLPFCFSLFAQNDTTDDSWINNSTGAVETDEPVLIKKYLTFSGTDAPRGLSRDNNAFSLDIWGGSTANNGAGIVLSGDLRGGANNFHNGRLEMWTGGENLTSQAVVGGDFSFGTRWNEGEKTLMTLKSKNGRVGIGTNNPSAFMHIQGPTSGYNPGESGLKVEGRFNTYAASIINTFGGNNAGGLLIETTDGNNPNYTDALKVVVYRSNNPKTSLRIPNFGAGYHIYMLENGGGKVGIGTTDPQNTLDVCGIARANEVIVQNDWCDFVFDENYDLPTLAEQKAFIEQNGHLKNFQSEAEMDGQILVGDVNKRQQQSIEEMMLYLIKMEERIRKLEEENARLKAEEK